MSDVAPIVDKNGNEFSTSFMGVSIKGKGSTVVFMLVVIAATALILLALEQQNTLLKDQMSAHATALTTHDASLSQAHDAQNKQHSELIGALRAQLYIMCQGNSECRKFDLQMPEALREMQRRY